MTLSYANECQARFKWTKNTLEEYLFPGYSQIRHISYSNTFADFDKQRIFLFTTVA